MKTQRNKVLDLLLEAGTRGVNSHDLTYIFSIKQAPTRVKELREAGYNIVSETLPNKSVQYVLDGVPLKDRPFRYVFEGNTARRVYQ